MIFNTGKCILKSSIFKILLRNSSFENISKRVYIETYGCQMNFNDSDIAFSILQSNGYTRVNDIKSADIALLMTCAIRDSAEAKIWQRLHYFNSFSTRRRPLKIGVLGCMAERLKSQLLEHPTSSVDVVCGPDAYRDLPRLLADAEMGNKGMNVALSLEETYADVRPVRICNDNNAANKSTVPSAFVSIMRGCDNMCTYCIVPFTRGRERSRPIDSIVDEVTQLYDQGVREVVLLGQNVNSYRDLSESSFYNRHFCESDQESEKISNQQTKLASGFGTVYRKKVGGRRFTDLLYCVSKISPELRIRFTSPHPKDFPNELLYLIRDTPNIAKMIHMPAQSGSSAVLDRMKRGYSREAYLNLVNNIRSIIPDVGITSDFIAGFCGETEEEHQETISLLQLVKYNFVYCFPYSMREKTRAYHRLVDDVPEVVKKRRHLEICEEFRKHALSKNESMIGSIQLVLLDSNSKRSENRWIGRNEVNTKVVFDKSPTYSDDDSCLDCQMPNFGEYVAVRIVGATSQTLRGESLLRSSIKTFNKDNIERIMTTRDKLRQQTL